MKLYLVYEYSDPDRGWGISRYVGAIKAENKKDAIEKFTKKKDEKLVNVRMGYGFEEISKKELEKHKNRILEEIVRLQLFVSDIEETL